MLSRRSSAGSWSPARRDLFPAQPAGPIFGATPALLVGLVGRGRWPASLISLCCTRGSRSAVRADQIISGTIINIAAFGLTGYLNRLHRVRARRCRHVHASSSRRTELDGPAVRRLDLRRCSCDQGPIAMSVIVLVIILAGPALPDPLGTAHPSRRRASQGRRHGRHRRHPRCATGTCILGGVFAGLAGAYLTLEATGSFQNGMTAGRGFIALAAVIFGRWTPLGAFAGALLFAALGALGHGDSTSRRRQRAQLGERAGGHAQPGSSSSRSAVHRDASSCSRASSGGAFRRPPSGSPTRRRAAT